MTATTAPAPSSAATDASAGSSTATSTPTTQAAQPAPPQSIKDRMLAKATATQAPTSSPATPAAKDAQNGDAPGSSPGKTDDADDGAQKSDEKDVDSKKKQPETVPMAAFKARIAEEKQKRDAAQAEVHRLTLAETKYKTALELMQAEVARLTQQLQEGRPYSEAEEELAARDLTLKGKELSAKLQAEHAEKLREINEAAAREERFTQAQSQISESIETAIAKYPLVTFSEVAKYLADHHKKTGKLPSATESARLIDEHKRKQLAALGYTQAPAAPRTDVPVTVSGPTGGATLGRTGNSRADMTRFAQAHLGHR